MFCLFVCHELIIQMKRFPTKTTFQRRQGWILDPENDIKQLSYPSDNMYDKCLHSCGISHSYPRTAILHEIRSDRFQALAAVLSTGTHKTSRVFTPNQVRTMLFHSPYEAASFRL